MEPAYAKLKGPTFEGYIRDLKVVFGRGIVSEGFISLGEEDKTISRKHAEIEWSYEKSKFIIRCIGRNPIVVNRKRIDQESPPQVLESKTPIRIGKCCFYFLLPKENNEII